MLRTMRTLLVTGLLLLCLPVLQAADKDEMVDNPAYTAWAKFKPGAASTVIEETTYSSNKNPVPDQKVITYTLVSVSAEKVVVRTVVVERELLGTVESAPTKHTYPAKLKKSYLAVVAPELTAKKGEETMKWKGKDMPCKTLYGSFKKEGEAVEFKAWTNDSIPGGVVKRTRSMTQQTDLITTTVTLQSYKAGK